MNDIRRSQRGALMIEVLLALAIVIFGVLSVLRVQTRLQQSEVEAYQRTQALILLNDLSSRIETNRNDAAAYVTASALGAGMNCATLPTDPNDINLQESDMSDWCNALQGASETQSTTNVGAMIGGRGCVEETVGPGVREYMITVTWQGLTPISAPPASVACGMGDYDEAGTACVDDLCRRYVTTVVRIADLEDI
jgi:type IV pilus assembly protein PilV